MYIQTELDLTRLDNIEEEVQEHSEDFLEHKLITNGEGENFLLELKEAFKTCKGFYFSVAFINFSGLQLILDDLKNLAEKNIKGTIITSTYLNFTQVGALKKLKEFNNIDLRIFVTDEKFQFFLIVKSRVL